MLPEYDRAKLDDVEALFLDFRARELLLVLFGQLTGIAALALSAVGPNRSRDDFAESKDQSRNCRLFCGVGAGGVKHTTMPFPLPLSAGMSLTPAPARQ